MGNIEGFYSYGMSAANRVVNQLLGVVLTSIALVIPLSSNLYSPKLVPLYLGHPIILTGLSVLVINQASMVCSLMLGPTHPLYANIVLLTTLLTFFSLAGILPYLYFVSFFLRPAYFMPLISHRCIKLITRLSRAEKDNQEHYRTVFETVDVIANIALTGMRRGDRQLILLCLRALHNILVEYLHLFKDEQERLENIKPYFVSGLVREGQLYLKDQKIWPEAYILAQLLEIMEQSDRRQHQLLAELAELLVTTTKIAVEHQREDLIELHVLVFNALMRMSIDENDLRKFQNLSYHYRLLIEELAWEPMWMKEVVKHLVHYGNMANKNKMNGAFETVLYDIGELCLSLARIDNHIATEFAENHAIPIWFEAISAGGHLEAVAWRSLVRVHWESVVVDNRYLMELLEETYLHDQKQHKKYVEKMLSNNRPLHWEFNDRLLRMAYLSPEAERMAWDYTTRLEDEAMIQEEPLRDEEDL